MYRIEREVGPVKTSKYIKPKEVGVSSMVIHIFAGSGKMLRKMFSKENDFISSKVDLVENGEISQEF